MALSFIKYLAVFFLNILFFNKIAFAHVETVAIHPFYVSVTDITHNKKDRTLEISAKIFTDDFEKVLSAANATEVDLINGNKRQAMDRLVQEYLKNRLVITVNDRIMAFTYIGYEHESEAVYCYLEIKDITQVKKISIQNSLLHDLNESQMNIMHVSVDGVRQSTKLNFPATAAQFNF